MINGKLKRLIQNAPEISLTTYRPNGTKARVPMWHYFEDDSIFMISSVDSKKVQNLLLRPQAIIVVKSEGREIKLLGDAKIINSQSEKFISMAEKIWALHPTYYGDFQDILAQWQKQCVLIEVKITQVLE